MSQTVGEPWCDHCDLPMRTCVHGNPPKVIEPEPAIRTMEAKVHSRCPDCRGPIEPGDTIGLTEEFGMWVCKRCFT